MARSYTRREQRDNGKCGGGTLPRVVHAAPEPPLSDDSAEASTADWKVGLASAAIALACLLVLVLLPRLARSSAASMKRPAPPIALRIVANAEEGSRFKLEDVQGRPVLVDFWAFWCGPCKQVSPIVDRVAKKYEARGLVTIGVSVDGDDEDARAAARAFGMTYPVLQDETHLVQQEYGITKLPSLVVIDRTGKIVGTTEGLVDEASLEAMVREVL